MRTFVAVGYHPMAPMQSLFAIHGSSTPLCLCASAPLYLCAQKKMIISASRRTDIPAFYAEWFMNRVRAGTCTVPNPFNPRQISHVSLDPTAVDAIVFWTRDPRPLLPHLAELDERGFRYAFLVTLTGYPRSLEPAAPPPDRALSTLRNLADRIGPSRIAWRYDPVIFSSETGVAFHRETFRRLSNALSGHTHRCILSILDPYAKVRRNLRPLEAHGFALQEWNADAHGGLMRFIGDTAAANGMTAQSCAEDIDLSEYGIRPGKCVDDAWLGGAVGVRVSGAKDRAQRPLCHCVASRDIGMYNTCVFGCRYCYATDDLEDARSRHRNHDATSPALSK